MLRGRHRVRESGIDNDLMVNGDEEVFEMNNECILCTVYRGVWSPFSAV